MEQDEDISVQTHSVQHLQ